MEKFWAKATKILLAVIGILVAYELWEPLRKWRERRKGNDPNYDPELPTRRWPDFPDKPNKPNENHGGIAEDWNFGNPQV